MAASGADAKVALSPSESRIVAAVLAAMGHAPTSQPANAPVATPEQRAKALLKPYERYVDGAFKGISKDEPLVSIDGVVTRPRGTPKRYRAHVELIRDALAAGKTVTVTPKAKV